MKGDLFFTITIGTPLSIVPYQGLSLSNTYTDSNPPSNLHTAEDVALLWY